MNHTIPMLNQRFLLHLPSCIQIAIAIHHHEFLKTAYFNHSLSLINIIHPYLPNQRATIGNRIIIFLHILRFHSLIPLNAMHHQLHEVPHCLLCSLHIHHHALTRRNNQALPLSPGVHSYSSHQVILLCVHIHLKPLLLIRQVLNAEQAGLQLAVLVADDLPLLLLRGFLRRQLSTMYLVNQPYLSSLRI